MWQLKNRWSPRQRVLAVLCSILAASAPNLAIAQGGPAPSYRGEDLFRGLFLGQGPVAELFPEIWDEVAAYQANAIPAEDWDDVQEEISHHVDKLLERIAVDGPPDYFETFATEIQSGDQLRVEEAVLDGTDRLIAAIAVDLGVPPEDLKPFDPNLIPVIIVVVVAAAVAVVSLAVLASQLAAAVWAVSVVAVFHFVAAVNTRVGVRRNFEPGYSTLAQDTWVNWITTRLAV